MKSGWMQNKIKILLIKRIVKYQVIFSKGKNVKEKITFIFIR